MFPSDHQGFCAGRCLGISLQELKKCRDDVIYELYMTHAKQQISNLTSKTKFNTNAFSNAKNHENFIVITGRH